MFMKNPKLITLFLALFVGVVAVAQDTIVFENKHYYLVEVLEESQTKVTYKKFPEQRNLAYIIQKRFITDVLYQDPSSRASKFKRDTLVQDRQLELWVTKMEQRSLFSGLMHRMDDSTLILKKKTSLFEKNGKNGPEVVYIFPYNQISHISARKQNRIVQYAFAGAGAGFFLGTLSGLVGFKDSAPCDPVVPGMNCDASLFSPQTRWEKSLALGFGSTAIGALAGGIVGGIKVRIPIGGKQDLFNAAVPRLNRMNRALRKK